MTKFQRSFTIRLAKANREAEILAFHHANIGEFLWPRTLEEFKELVEKKAVFEIIEKSRHDELLVGICYIRHDTEPSDASKERDEFGGIYILENYEGLGLGSVIGRLAISHHFISQRPDVRLVAHVHEANPEPRGLLEGQLGFSLVDQEIPPREIVPENMKTNEEGNVVGDLFEFSKPHLKEFAAWLSKFDGQISGKKKVSSKLKIDLSSLEDIQDAVKALKEIAKE